MGRAREQEWWYKRWRRFRVVGNGRKCLGRFVMAGSALVMVGLSSYVTHCKEKIVFKPLKNLEERFMVGQQSPDRNISYANNTTNTFDNAEIT